MILFNSYGVDETLNGIYYKYLSPTETKRKIKV